MANLRLRAIYKTGFHNRNLGDNCTILQGYYHDVISVSGVKLVHSDPQSKIDNFWSTILYRGYMVLHPTQVRANYLQLIDNLLEAIPDSILESQQQANTSTRCFKLDTMLLIHTTSDFPLCNHPCFSLVVLLLWLTSISLHIGYFRV